MTKTEAQHQWETLTNQQKSQWLVTKILGWAWSESVEYHPLVRIESAWELLQRTQIDNLDLFNRVARALLPVGYQSIGQGLLLSRVLQWTPEQICATLYVEWHAQKSDEALREIVRISEDAGLYPWQKNEKQDYFESE